MAGERPSSRLAQYLDRFYVDSAIFDQRSLKLLVDVMGEDHVMLGSDYPYPLGEEHIGELIRKSQFSAEAKQKMLAGNAAEFFGLEPLLQKKTESAASGRCHNRWLSFRSSGPR